MKRIGFFVALALSLLVFPGTPFAQQTDVKAAQPGPAVLATAEGETSGTRVEIKELKVSEGALTLRFAMINDSNKKIDFGHNFADADRNFPDFQSIGGSHLIDTAGKKKYNVIRDADKKCVCSRNLGALKPKSSMNLWAKFPAPPDDVKKMTVVIPHFEPVENVPVSR